jgi:glycogen debranching enzyme
LGTAGEIFDGDAPFTPRGCFAQAWTVAETLRAWTTIASEGISKRAEVEPDTE